MKLGIDMHNLRDGGGVSYITNLLRAFDPSRHGFSRVHVFGAAAVLARLPDRPWIEKHADPLLSKSLPYRLWFLFFRLGQALQHTGCNMLYSPGGLYFGGFRPFATISRNMMPFEPQHWRMYPRLSFDRLRLVLLRWAHAATFRRADGMVFLTRIAQRVVGTAIGPAQGQSAVIAHGVDRQLFNRVGRQALPVDVKPSDAIRLVYPSRLEPYKHQVEVIAAVASLRSEFPALCLDLCGPANPAYGMLVAATMAKHDPAGQFVRYLGEVPLVKLPDLHERSHLMVFASSCENLPNTLIEAMSFGIPIVSADRPPMPEVAQDACLYFDPTDSQAIASAIRQTLANWPASLARAQTGLQLAAAYSWDHCADLTFRFLMDRCKTGRATPPNPPH